MMGVLHTWGRTLTYHPHVHYVVPGGGLNADGTQWLNSGPAFFLPVRAASVVYREKFKAEMERAGLLEQIPRSVWSEAWVVDSQAVGDGRKAMKYLAPYVYRVAISNHRIETIEDTLHLPWRAGLPGCSGRIMAANGAPSQVRKYG